MRKADGFELARGLPPILFDPMLVMKMSSRQIRYGDGECIRGRVKLREEGITWSRGVEGPNVDAFRVSTALR